MTDRGLPLADGAPACPFVAFDDDRDARATGPDHRHRCYAEVRPAPRALAHQEAYCLSSAFPVCPTFQDWARREAAQAKAAADHEPGETDRPEGRDPTGPPEPIDSSPPGVQPERPDSLGRNPPRSWAAPPPWLSSRDAEPDEEEPEVQVQPPIRGGGLAGSFADRLAAGPPARDADDAGRPAPPPARWRNEIDADDDEDEGRAEAWDAPRSGPSRPRRSDRDERRPAPAALPGPSWERPRRLEAYPTLKTRLGLASFRLPPILLGVAAVALAAIALFYLPALLGIGNPPDTGGSASPTPGASAAASGSPAAPTPTPGSSQQIYLVQGGDTMTIIADRFGVPLAALIEANRVNIPNPDVLQIGQEVIIPVAAPTTLPGVTPTPTPTPAA